jgi:hypothetical protein
MRILVLIFAIVVQLNFITILASAQSTYAFTTDGDSINTQYSVSSNSSSNEMRERAKLISKKRTELEFYKLWYFWSIIIFSILLFWTLLMVTVYFVYKRKYPKKFYKISFEITRILIVLILL